MAFITMPAPKVGTTFYDKPGNGRKLYKLKRLQDNKVICTPANDDGKEALILPIEAWEKLTGYKIGPDLLATMTFSPSAPPAEPKPAKAAKPAKPAKPAKSAKTTKAPAAPAAAPAAPAAPAAAPAAPLAAPISQDFARTLSAMLMGQPVSMRLAGDSNAATRQKIMETLTGVKTPKSKAGVNAIERILFEKLGIGTKGLSLNDQTRQLTARLEEIAASTPAATPDEVVRSPLPLIHLTTCAKRRWFPSKNSSGMLNLLPRPGVNGCLCGLALRCTGSQNKAEASLRHPPMTFCAASTEKQSLPR